MSTRGLDTGYLDLNPAVAWPVRPWAELAPTASGTDGIDGIDGVAGIDGPLEGGSVPAAAISATPRKSRDRGASAVEWVVITAIVVAIVTGVGVLISNAVKSKARNACTQIATTDTNTGGTGSTDCSSK